VTPERKSWTRWLLAALKLLLFGVLCFFVYWTFVNGNDTLSAHDWHAKPQWLVLSGVLYLAGLFPAAAFWHRVLLRAGQEVGFGEAIRAYYISQLGKYVPGKWMVILLRRTMLRTHSVETTVVAASVFFETLTMLTVGGAIGTLVLVVWHSNQLLLIALAAGSTLLLGVPTVPVIFQWLIQVLRVGKLNPTTGAKMGRVGARAIVIGWLTISCGWLLQGMSLWATLRAMDAAEGGPLVNLSLHTAAVALGIVAGFISQIPGGLVMREWISAELVEPLYGASVALVSAIIFRLVLLVSELAISIILYAAGWRRARTPAAAAQGELSASGNR
jgi:hypothetical protein